MVLPECCTGAFHLPRNAPRTRQFRQALHTWDLPRVMQARASHDAQGASSCRLQV